ncbi:outer membrane protein transport protein [Flavobacterium sp. CBA20B-1]|uniref:Outer membrane protein transport protein n=1 Tax=Paenimyroides aestuarii TaxID=2968490 RepID=A0ABY5NPA8_9FLAO|nr:MULTISPECIES: outer membrane protein transport protein [Flavobacteriaceae]UUV20358.1 outer membrane protein transport protein [Paenimyroides aestuarii]WCM43197.1 outer membrane protein transport protein [Flavobacterium sp. CBA20B-1]
MKKILSISLLSLIAANSFAGGYRISMQGQRQLAMGHTGVAVIGQNAESLFFNPASGTFLKSKWSFSAGATALFSNVKFQNSLYNWSNSSDNMGTPFYLYGNYQVSDRFSVGLAVYTPYGSSVEWKQDWPGSHLVNNIDLQAIFVQPTVSYKITDNISLGAGLIYVNGAVTFNRNLSRSLVDENGNRSDVTIDAQGVSAWGYNVGLTARLDDYVTFGANYRSQIDMKVEGGAANFNDLPSFLSSTYPNGKFDATMPLPAELTIGFSYQINNKWLAAVDYNYTFWKAYDNLVIEFDNPQIGTSVNPRNYKSSGTIRGGMQFAPSEKFSARVGGYYDISPVQDGYFAPETPRNDAIAGTLGFTYQVSPKFGIDFAASALHFKETKNSYDHYIEDGTHVSFGGDYRSAAYSLGLGLSYNF